MLDPGLVSFVRESLPPPPARVLEIGAGDGALARALEADGYEVVAIDPASQSRDVEPVALHELSARPGSFDAALAVLSLHHVEPLAASCRHLAQVVREHGVLVLDEIDFERFDERAAGWWLEHRDGGGPRHGHATSPAEIVAHLREHCHPLATLRAALEEAFELSPPVRGPYLYRWDLDPSLRETELDLIARGELPATGARFVGIRR